MEGYRSTESAQEYRYEIKKSVFLSESKMVTDVGEAEAFVEYIRNKHPKATHHCYAYSISVGGLKQRAEDDGEPSQTAGMPILKAINMNELQNVIIVVTRYFGGIKLGSGGLVRAYMQAAVGVIEEAGIREFKEFCDVKISMNYDFYDIFIRFINDLGLKVVDSTFAERVECIVRVEADETEGVITQLNDLSSGRIATEVVGRLLQ